MPCWSFQAKVAIISAFASYLYISEFDLYKTGLPEWLKSTSLFPRINSIEWDGRTPSFLAHMSYHLPRKGKHGRKSDPSHPNPEDVLYGVPLNLTVRYEINPAKQTVDVTVDWDGKRPTRIPESISVVFGGAGSGQSVRLSDPTLFEVSMLATDAGKSWLVEKLGSLVSPDDVFLNGSQFIHHTWVGAGRPGGVWLHTPDSGLLSVGTTRMLPYPLKPETTRTDAGVAVNLYNNMWGTNFLQWWPVDKAWV